MRVRHISIVLLVATLLALLSTVSYAAQIREQGISVASLLEKVRATSGANLWASDSVAEDPLTVLLDPDEPDTVARALDLLPGYQWVSLSAADAADYKVLGPDFEERNTWREVNDAAASERRARAAQVGIRRAHQYFDALALSESELQALAEEDPGMVCDLSDPSRRANIEFLSTLSEDQLEAACSWKRLKFNVRDLAPEYQESLIDWVRKSNAHRAEMDLDGGRREPTPADALNGTLTIDGYGPDEGFGIGLTAGETLFGSAVMRPKHYCHEAYRTGLRMQQGMSFEEAQEAAKPEIEKYNQIYADAEQKAQESRLKATPPRFGDRRASDGKLSEGLSGSSGHVLQSICSHSHFALIAYHPRYPQDVVLPEGTDLARALDLTAEHMHDYVWAYRDGAVLLTSRDCATRLAQHIPKAIIARFREKAAQQEGVLTLDDLAEMAVALNSAQLSGIPRNLPKDLARAGAFGLGFQHVQLRFYASLSNRQRARARAEGIPYKSLSRVQKELFLKAASDDGQLSEPVLFRIDDAEKETERSSHREATFIFSFADQSSKTRVFTYSLVLKDKAKSPTAPSDQKPEDNPAPMPTEPRALAVAASIAQWNYSSRKTRYGEEPRAVVTTTKGDHSVRRVLQVGNRLEGATLDEIEPGALTFTVDGATIVLPARRAVSLAPFDPTASDTNSAWIDIDEILSGTSQNK